MVADLVAVRTGLLDAVTSARLWRGLVDVEARRKDAFDLRGVDVRDFLGDVSDSVEQ